uniref:Alpha/beta hydrolase fold protein n=1 Tax=uncultured bacterium contig00051 TaxID=1181535 RepID=A0A806KPE5_9BACT|nr:alpha/beta hydrolase fold protein [uncultured bacterium contig00051]
MPGGGLFYYDSKVPGNGENSAGRGQTVILIHGLGDEADTWRHIFPALCATGYRVIAPDLPGFGRSIWKGRINMRVHCRAAQELLKLPGAADSGNPAIIIGSSLGAGIAELTAFKYPDLVQKIILIGGCFPFKYKLDKNILLASLPFAGKRWYRSFRLDHDRAWKSLFPYYYNLGSMGAEDREFLRKRVIDRVESKNQERGYFATMKSMGTFLPFNKNYMMRALRNFPGKIGMICGENDYIFPKDRTLIVRQIRPDIETIAIAGAGHLPHQEKPAETSAQILRIMQN